MKKVKKIMKHRGVHPMTEIPFHENPSVRIEKVSNGLVIHSEGGKKSIASNAAEAFKHAKKHLKIG